MYGLENLKRMSSNAVSSEHGPAAATRRTIKIGRTVIPKPGKGGRVMAQVFTMTLGAETIRLLPLKNWPQLDIFKWKARGLLPGTPVGLEITFKQVKVAGETVSTFDLQGCDKLEKAFNGMKEI